VEKLDVTLSQRVATSPNMGAEVEELHDALDSACRSSFRPVRSTKKALPHKSVPWWTQRLTILMKKVTAQRRRYQRTKGNNVLSDQRKEQHLASKAEYAVIIRKERSTS
jgi:hypothetical protein